MRWALRLWWRPFDQALVKRLERRALLALRQMERIGEIEPGFVPTDRLGHALRVVEVDVLQAKQAIESRTDLGAQDF